MRLTPADAATLRKARIRAKQDLFRTFYGEGPAMKITEETKAVLNTESGRVIGIVKSSEPGKISLAVPNDRAVMTPAQARELAVWLNGEADKATTTAQRATVDWRKAEAQRQADIRAALSTSPTGRFRSAY